jgi:hypothetical protein
MILYLSATVLTVLTVGTSHQFFVNRCLADYIVYISGSFTDPDLVFMSLGSLPLIYFKAPDPFHQRAKMKKPLDKSLDPGCTMYILISSPRA